MVAIVPPSILNREDRGDITIVSVVDTNRILGDDLCGRVGAYLISLSEEEGRVKLVFNMAGVDAISSALTGKLIRLHKRLPQGQKLIFCGLEDHIAEIFEITKLDKLFVIAKDEDAALTLLT